MKPSPEAIELLQLKREAVTCAVCLACWAVVAFALIFAWRLIARAFP